MYDKRNNILKQQDDKNPHVLKSYPSHLLRICVTHVSIFNCFYKKGYHKETSDLFSPYK